MPASTTTDSVATPTRAPLSAATTALIVAVLAVAIALVALVRTESSTTAAGEHVAAAARDNRIQAVYLTNDQVLFGTVEARDGDWVQVRDAYSLQNQAAADDAEADGATLQVVPANAAIGGDGNVNVNAREIVLVQNLASDSDIARAVEDARD